MLKHIKRLAVGLIPVAGILLFLFGFTWGFIYYPAHIVGGLLVLFVLWFAYWFGLLIEE